MFTNQTKYKAVSGSNRQGSNNVNFNNRFNFGFVLQKVESNESGTYLIGKKLEHNAEAKPLSSEPYSALNQLSKETIKVFIPSSIIAEKRAILEQEIAKDPKKASVPNLSGFIFDDTNPAVDFIKDKKNIAAGIYPLYIISGVKRVNVESVDDEKIITYAFEMNEKGKAIGYIQYVEVSNERGYSRLQEGIITSDMYTVNGEVKGRIYDFGALRAENNFFSPFNFTIHKGNVQKIRALYEKISEYESLTDAEKQEKEKEGLELLEEVEAMFSPKMLTFLKNLDDVQLSAEEFERSITEIAVGKESDDENKAKEVLPIAIGLAISANTGDKKSYREKVGEEWKDGEEKPVFSIIETTGIYTPIVEKEQVKNSEGKEVEIYISKYLKEQDVRQLILQYLQYVIGLMTEETKEGISEYKEEIYSQIQNGAEIMVSLFHCRVFKAQKNSDRLIGSLKTTTYLYDGVEKTSVPRVLSMTKGFYPVEHGADENGLVLLGSLPAIFVLKKDYEGKTLSGATYKVISDRVTNILPHYGFSTESEPNAGQYPDKVTCLLSRLQHDSTLCAKYLRYRLKSKESLNNASVTNNSQEDGEIETGEQFHISL